jgi:NADH dehydrogenase FAD-containing subunit
VVDTDFLMHSYLLPARRRGYTFIQSEITGIDREKRQVHTVQGYVEYDWLVL